MFKSREKTAQATPPLRRFNFIKGNNAALANNPQFQFARKHSLVHYPSGAVYSFIPKNACTTMRASLAVANGFLAEEDLVNQINWVHNNTYTFSATVPELVKAPYTFTILRDPHERLVSLFLDKFVEKTPVAWNFYRATNNRFNLDELTFAEFVNALAEQPGLLRADIHWRPQVDFLVYEKYDDYLTLDKIKEDKNTLTKKINLKTIDTRHITYHGKENLTTQEIPGAFNYSSINLKKIRTDSNSTPKTINMFNDELTAITGRLFKQDFNLIQCTSQNNERT